MYVDSRAFVVPIIGSVGSVVYYCALISRLTNVWKIVGLRVKPF